MNEIDLFTEMADEQELNEILSFFKETVPGIRKNSATIEQKRNHVKRVFKSQTPGMIRKRKKNGADPFYAYINKYSVFKLSTENTFEENIILLKEKEDNTPSYVRFAVLLLKHPTEIRERLELIYQNVINGKDPLTFGTNFKNNDELKGFLRKHKFFLDKNLSTKIFKKIEEYLTEDEIKEIHDCKNTINSFSLIDYFNIYKELEKKYSKAVVNTAFVQSHKNEDEDILLMFALEATFDILKRNNYQQVEEIENKLYKLESEILVSKKENNSKLLEKDNYIQHLKNNNKEISKQLEKLKKENREKINALEIVDNKLRKKEEELNVFKLSIEKEKEELVYKYEDRIKGLENIIEINKFVEEERIQKFQSPKIEVNWGVICMSDYNLTQELFSELHIAEASKKESYTDLIKNPDIKHIYISMRGLPTKRFQTIKGIIKSENKTYESLNFNSFKELIEWVGYKKTIEKMETIKL